MGAGGGGMGMGCGMGPGMGGMMFHSLDQLNLSTEQWSKVQSLRDAHMKEVMPIQNQLFAKNNELRLLWNQTNPDGAQVKAKEKELGELQMQMREKATQFMLDVRKVSDSGTADQAERNGAGDGPAPRCWIPPVPTAVGADVWHNPE